jgi:hypothetical protein
VDTRVAVTANIVLVSCDLVSGLNAAVTAYFICSAHNGKGERMMFVELKKQEYYRGGYVSNPAMFAVDDIARIVQCTDDYNYTNIVTKDGKVHTIHERYDDVAKKIRDAERRQE